MQNLISQQPSVPELGYDVKEKFPPFLTVDSLIAYLESQIGKRYVPQTIYDKVCKCQIPIKKRLKPLLFEKVAIDRWIENGMKMPIEGGKLKIRKERRKNGK